MYERVTEKTRNCSETEIQIHENVNIVGDRETYKLWNICAPQSYRSYRERSIRAKHDQPSVYVNVMNL